MITRRTKVQLMVFALITMVGVAFVGAKYARLDRLVVDESYNVTAHFADSGGIFTGAEVSYRGVTVGQVSSMKLTAKGVDVVLDIDNDHKDIPKDTEAVVANRSAVGEQFVDLQPKTKSGPYLADGSQIAMSDTKTPIDTTKFLTDIDTTVNSVNKQSLNTTVDELGKAFGGSGEDLGRLVDTSTSFINAANDNFDTTTALLQDSNTVLQTQIDKRSAIKSFSRDLALFSTTLAQSDPDLRRVIDNGSATANELRTFLERNKVDLGQLINNLVTTGEITGRHINGTEMLLVVYPYVVAGGYTVVAKDPQTHLYDAHFGLILQQNPTVCHNGYQGTDRRSPYNRGNRPMATGAHCAEPAGQSNARGAQNAPRRPAPAYRAPVVGSYDPATKKFRYTDTNPSGDVTYTGGAASLMGADSWKWLLAQPLAQPSVGQE
jgi:phospholipid/cholesterol/gamma-HCH transport system substrate-binding protein